MTREELIEFLRANTTSFLATIERGEPRVRAMGIYRVDADGILFGTETFKDVYHQLHEGETVELCVFEPTSNTQVRVRGIVQMVDDQALKEKMVADRPFLQPIVDAKGYEVLAIFRIAKCHAIVWHMSERGEEHSIIEL